MLKLIQILIFFIPFLSIAQQECLEEPFNYLHESQDLEDFVELPNGDFIFIERIANFSNPEDLFSNEDSIAAKIIKINSDLELIAEKEYKIKSLEDYTSVSTLFFIENQNKILVKCVNVTLEDMEPFPFPVSQNARIFHWLDLDLNEINTDTFPLTIEHYTGTSFLFGDDDTIIELGSNYVDNDENSPYGAIQRLDLQGNLLDTNYYLPHYEFDFPYVNRSMTFFDNPREYFVVYDDYVNVLDKNLNLIDEYPYTSYRRTKDQVGAPEGVDYFFINNFTCYTPEDSINLDSCYEVITKVSRNGEIEEFRFNGIAYDLIAPVPDPNFTYISEGFIDAKHDGYIYSSVIPSGVERVCTLNSLEANGNVRWSKMIKGAYPEEEYFYIKEIIATQDTGVVVTFLHYNHIDLYSNGTYIIKLDKEGNLQNYLVSTEETGLPLIIEDIKTYPNPTNAKISFSGNIPPNSRIEVYNLQGQIIKSKYISDKNDLDMSNLSSSIYPYIIKDEKGNIIFRGKIVKI